MEWVAMEGLVPLPPFVSFSFLYSPEFVSLSLELTVLRRTNDTRPRPPRRT